MPRRTPAWAAPFQVTTTPIAAYITRREGWNDATWELLGIMGTRRFGCPPGVTRASKRYRRARHRH
jgi:hypothetical protein